MKFVSIAAVLLFVTSCNNNSIETKKTPTTKEQLGELLFFDPILSSTNKISCSSCHIPAYAFADTLPLSKGVDGKLGTRNTPSAMNQASRTFFFHDGRAQSLEEQAFGPMENPVEMNLPMYEIVRKLNESNFYFTQFKKLYNEKATKENIANALSLYERKLETDNSPFDNYMQGDETAMSESAKRGQIIFNEKGKCFDCHFGPDFTGDEFRNIGLYNEKELNDAGRFEVTKDSEDIGKFKVPGLRNVSITAPYMHNGMFKTLKEVIDYYNTPTLFVKGSINPDSLISKPLLLTNQEKSDLLNFLECLTDKRFIKK